MVVKKDQFAEKHHELELPNIQAMKLMQSFKSKGFVTEVYNWRWLYYTLTDSGVEYLREYLHVPAEFVPKTQQKPSRPQPAAPSFKRGTREERDFGGKKNYGDRDGAPDFAGRGGYRRGGGRGGFRGGRGGFRGGRGGGRGGFRGNNSEQ
jgi:small subunit ribosomal protein S10e